MPVEQNTDWVSFSDTLSVYFRWQSQNWEGTSLGFIPNWNWQSTTTTSKVPPLGLFWHLRFVSVQGKIGYHDAYFAMATHPFKTWICSYFV